MSVIERCQKLEIEKSKLFNHTLKIDYLLKDIQTLIYEFRYSNKSITVEIKDPIAVLNKIMALIEEVFNENN